MKPPVSFAADSHSGNRYEHNEDSLGWDEEAGVWLVADGMGGHACGDIASRTAKRCILGAMAVQDPDAPLPSVVQLVADAHDAVVAEGVRRSAENMGSTVVLVRVLGNVAEIGWCGDSRAYLWRDNQLVRLTRDHSLLEQLLEAGVVDPADAFGHPQKHVLVQALGITNPPPVPAQLRVELAPGDRLLLCSDGLHDVLRDSEINEQLVAHPEPGAAVAALLEQVLKGSAPDNISMVCIDPAVSSASASDAGPALSVAQLRERFERLPGRRPVAVASSRLPTPERTPVSQSRPGIAEQAGQSKAAVRGRTAGFGDFDRDLFIALGVVLVLILLVLWLI